MKSEKFISIFEKDYFKIPPACRAGLDKKLDGHKLADMLMITIQQIEDYFKDKLDAPKL